MTLRRYIFRCAVVVSVGGALSLTAASFVHPHAGAGVFVFTLLALVLLKSPG
jgi:hypothetical protein